ncbi:MAG: hypothetical protein AAF480_12480 [Actinomycetota bacterium]
MTTVPRGSVELGDQDLAHRVVAQDRVDAEGPAAAAAEALCPGLAGQWALQVRRAELPLLETRRELVAEQLLAGGGVLVLQHRHEHTGAVHGLDGDRPEVSSPGWQREVRRVEDGLEVDDVVGRVAVEVTDVDLGVPPGGQMDRDAVGTDLSEAAHRCLLMRSGRRQR